MHRHRLHRATTASPLSIRRRSNGRGGCIWCGQRLGVVAVWLWVGCSCRSCRSHRSYLVKQFEVGVGLPSPPASTSTTTVTPTHSSHRTVSGETPGIHTTRAQPPTTIHTSPLAHRAPSTVRHSRSVCAPQPGETGTPSTTSGH